MQKLTIAPDFQALCQKQTDEELRLLEESLIEEGCHHAIVVWQCGKQTIIVDGHTRYAICRKNNIPYKLRFLKVESRQEATYWAARNQLGRRNSTEEQKSYLRGKAYRHSKLPQGRPTEEGKCGQNVHITESERTAEKIAAETGVTERTVRRDADFSEAVDDLAEKSQDLKDAALRGEIPKSSVPLLAEAPKSALRKLENLEGKELREAVRELTYTCPNCGGKERDEDGDCVACREPAETPKKKPAEVARETIGGWADTVGRFLSRSPSVDDYRGKWPSKQGDAALSAVKACYEALKAWQKALK